MLVAWRMIAVSLVSGLSESAPAANQAVVFQAGGGPLTDPVGECIPATERKQAEFNSAAYLAGQGGGLPKDAGPAPYPFVPIAGTEWQDRFVNNFVDLDPSTGILDWDCTDFTYDGHQGHDIVLRSFGEQDVGVPVFAALDGTVTDAHDGEFDRNTVWQGQPANYVVIYHGGTHYTWYWHLRRNSVAVTVGQPVRAGTQIGLAASSGNSTGPHLHFESRNNGTFFEPSAGTCRPGQTGWVNQIPIRRDTWIEDFAIHNTNNFPSGAFLPYDPVRTGTFIRTGTFQPIGIWYIIHNQSANSSWRVRYLRPNATVLVDSGTQAYSNPANPFYRYRTWWVYYNLNPDVAGTWTLELSVNGEVMVLAPFTVLNSGGVPANRPPNPVTARLDPPSPNTNEVVFCRLTVPLLEDPDYDLVRFRYQWRTNGQIFRDVTNAAFSDAVPRGSAAAGDLLTCTATPYDGHVFGPAAVAQTLMPGAPIRLTILQAPSSQVSLRWPISQVTYILESVTDSLAASNWTVVTDAQTTSGSQIVVTSKVTATSRYFRLRWP
jgi:murein DD-endopeptidase MepM/ murein hydrolase activator NlpD